MTLLNMKDVSKSILDKIIMEYQSGIGQSELSKKYGIKSKAISFHIKKHTNIPYRLRTYYKCNQSFFEIIDTEEKAYWLGMMYADGYVCYDQIKHKYFFCLGLKRADKEIIESFKKSLESNHPTKYRSYYDSRTDKRYYKASILICSQKMAADLTKLGCGQRKSNKIRFPSDETVPQHLKRHFVRGFWDGDGSWGIYNNGINLSFKSNYEFCKELQLWLINQCGVNKTKITQSPGCYDVGWGGRWNAYRVYHLLYDDSTIWMGRKKLIPEQFLATPTVYKSPDEHKRMIEDYIGGMPYKKICTKYDISKDCLYRQINKNNIKLRKKPKMTISTEDTQKLIGSYNNGLTYKQLAKQFNLTKYVVFTMLKKHGVIKGIRKFTKEQIQNLIELYRIGIPCKELLLKFNIKNQQTLCYVLKKYGVLPQRNKSIPKELNVRIIQDYADGMKHTDIATKYNIGVSTVYKTISGKR
jgi:Mor family transcriptional regulator